MTDITQVNSDVRENRIAELRSECRNVLVSTLCRSIYEISKGRCETPLEWFLLSKNSQNGSLEWIIVSHLKIRKREMD
jgi:hypothetical protein